MLCPARRDRVVGMGCCRARCCRRGRRGDAHIHQPGRRVNQNGRHTIIKLSFSFNKLQIESLPMHETRGQALQNVLSISTAANNRYLLHFSTLNSLTQWTAAIRLSMFENTSLQEAYTGSLVAGKGKTLNNIRQVMERTRFKYEDWARVRFGAGTPWRRCWFVVAPPDEKEVQKAQKAAKKGRSPYAKMPVIKGTLKFYESKRITKRTKPIASIDNAFAAYAVYPQSRPLIDQSTLVKVEGRITIHADREKTADGFVFVMPETHPAVSGFEMLMRFLFPVWDTFALYGRPNRLVADVRDTRGLMFAMPKDRRYGYLELLDVSNLILQGGAINWTERDWRKKLKDLTSSRMLALANGEGEESYDPGNKANVSRSSLPVPQRNKLRFGNSASGRNSPVGDVRRSQAQGLSVPPQTLQHRRSTSEGIGFENSFSNLRNSMNSGNESPPAPPPHGDAFRSHSALSERHEIFETASESSGERSPNTPEKGVPADIQALASRSPPPLPVAAPPSLTHGPGYKPRPLPMPQAMMGNLDSATMSQLHEVSQSQRSPYQVANALGPRPPSRENSYSPYNPYAGPERGSWPNPGQENDYPTAVIQQHYQPQQPRGTSRYPPPTLATIPASPYVAPDGVPGQAPSSYFQPAQQTVAEHPGPPNPPPHVHDGGILRKPVGGTSPNAHPAMNQLVHRQQAIPARSQDMGESLNTTQGQRISNLGPIGSNRPAYSSNASNSPMQPPQYSAPHSAESPPQNTQAHYAPQQPLQPMAPPPSMMQYGGQSLPYADVMAMRKRDMAIYGPDYVAAMERAPQVTAFREGPQRQGQGQQQQQYQPPQNYY
jgi:CCR4-NOT transcriptional complex subunit CAF120